MVLSAGVFATLPHVWFPVMVHWLVHGLGLWYLVFSNNIVIHLDPLNFIELVRQLSTVGRIEGSVFLHWILVLNWRNNHRLICTLQVLFTSILFILCFLVCTKLLINVAARNLWVETISIASRYLVGAIHWSWHAWVAVCVGVFLASFDFVFFGSWWLLLWLRHWACLISLFELIIPARLNHHMWVFWISLEFWLLVLLAVALWRVDTAVIPSAWILLYASNSSMSSLSGSS